MKNLYLYFIVALSSCFNGSAQCITNGGFENGLVGYTFTRQQSGNFEILNCDVDTSVGFTQPATPSAVVDQFNTNTGTLVSNNTAVSGGNDPVLLSCSPSIAVPRVHTGTRAMRLNRSGGGTDITTMSQLIQPAGTSISFSFSLLIENPHPDEPEAQPFFSVRLYDSQNNIVNTNQVCIVADINNTVFENTIYNNPTFGATELLYTGWECVRLNIPEELVNEELRLEFIIADCGQSGHFGTVYIDDITCTADCTDPVFGLLELNPVQYTCPSDVFSVCGNYISPEDGVLNNIQLEIVQNNTVVQTITSTSLLSADEFCFEVSPSLFGNNAIGNFEFNVTASFSMGSFSYTLEDWSAVTGPDVSFLGIDISDSYVTVNELYWEDINAESYEVEFFTDAECCPREGSVTPSYYSVTVMDNHLDLNVISTALRSKCFRWRVKASDCLGWSEWCCLAYDTDNSFPNANWGNYIEDGCYNDEIDLCEPYLYEEDPVVSGAFSFEQRQISIIAVNTIQNGANAMYRAGDHVTLLPGFIAESGSVFLAKIESCYSETAGGAMIMLKSKTKEKSPSASDFSNKGENGFLAFPNPTNGKLTIQSNDYIEIYTVVDISGKELLKIYNNNNSHDTEINLSTFAPGIYFIYANGTPVQKIIKE